MQQQDVLLRETRLIAYAISKLLKMVKGSQLEVQLKKEHSGEKILPPEKFDYPLLDATEDEPVLIDYIRLVDRIIEASAAGQLDTAGSLILLVIDDALSYMESMQELDLLLLQQLRDLLAIFPESEKIIATYSPSRQLLLSSEG